MRKILLGTIAAAGMSLAMAGGASADDQVGFCKWVNDEYSSVSVGECMSTINQFENGNWALGVCKIIRVKYGNGVNIGQCIKYFGGPGNNNK
jgi:phosphoribosylformylglycinamidine (FGAM) synthase-like amidotransferase family enzyme